MLNNTFFPANSGVYPLGANCHQQRQAQIPVWVITDLTGKILLGNAPQNNGQQNEWLVTGGRITINRFFQASTAMIVLSCSNTNFDVAYPTLPTKVARAYTKPGGTEPSLRDDLGYPLDKNDEICIWCGYIDKLRPVVIKDLQEHRLIRTFIGAIDTISVVGSTTQGVTMIIQCRDRIKYLMDSVGTFNTSDFDPLASGSAGSIDVNSSKTDGSATEKDKITRSDIILEIARRCLGHLQGSPAIINLAPQCNSVCGMRINPGYIAEYTQVNDTDGTGYQAMYDITNTGNSYTGHKYSKGNSIPFIGGSTTTPTIAVPSIDPTFNIVTGRLPYKRNSLDAKALASNQNITDRVPAEFIKFLSMQEPWPTEFFCDARSGEYWYAPRGLDISGLADPKRFFRTYFFRNAPAGALNAIKASATKMVGDIMSGIINPPVNESTTTASNAAGTDDVTVEWKGVNYRVNKAQVLDQLTFSFLDLNPFKKPLTAEEKIVVDIIKQLKATDSSNSSTLAQWAETFFQQNIVDADTAQVLDQQAKAQKTEGLASLNSSISLVPDLGTIHTAQTALLFREESSTINWRSNIIVTARITNDDSQQRAVHLKLIPSWLQGRNFACSYFTAEDETLGNNQAELVTVALAFARLYSKELKAATIHILGDPSMVPGECVQVFGSPMHPDSMKPQQDNTYNWLWDREAITAYVTAYQDLYKNRIKAHKTEATLNENPTEPPVAANPKDLESVKKNVPKIGDNVNTITDLTKYAQAQLMCPAYFDDNADPSATAATTATTGTVAKYAGMTKQQLETALLVKYNEFIAEKSGYTPATNVTQITKELLDSFPTLTSGGYNAPESNDKVQELKDLRAALDSQVTNPTQAQQPNAPQASEKTSLGLNEISFPEDPKTMWRVEAVIHKFNEQPGSGFRTELALLSPF